MAQALATIPDHTKRSAKRGPRDAIVVRELLGALLAAGTLDRLAMDRASQAQHQTGERIDVVLLQLGLLTETALLHALAQYFELPVADSAQYPVDPVLPDILQFDYMRRLRFVAVAAAPTEVTIVAADPFASDAFAAIGYLLDRHVKVQLALARDVDAVLDRLSGGEPLPATVGTDTEITGKAQEDDVQRLRDIASEAPVIRLVNRLISAAIERRASDIHIEPNVDSLRVRYRVDGAMVEADRLSPDLQAGIATRVKILGRLNIAERRLPQDGRSKFVLGGREIDLRIATAPLLHGESIVIRILDRDAVQLDFAALGFDANSLTRLETLFAAPNGIILVTGPTGSGKTTTLYAALQALNSTERKVFTVEDPIEYQLPGVNQMQIKPAIGLDFVHCLRSILRQDPDVVMIGEMRDVETARTGIQASLTGHLVLSTLHTNSASASVTRLLDMGAEDYLLASTILGILAQRLVRRLCRECAVDVDNPAQALAVLAPALQKFASALPSQAMKQPVGCACCGYTGYKGRTTIAEILVVDDAIRAKIVRGTTDRQIEAIACAAGMETLMQAGLRKVMAGETALGEVLRVART